MFSHSFKYTIKTLLRKKMLIFWTFAFPILLGTFFNMAFSDIEKSETMKVIKIAIVDNDEFKTNDAFKESFKYLSDEENNERLFDIEYTDVNRAKELLENKEITGYLIIENEIPRVVVNNNGTNETIFSYAVEEIQIRTQTATNIIANEVQKSATSGIINMQEIYSKATSIIESQDVILNNVSRGNLSYTMIEFYTLIAMACLYGGIISMSAINDKLANMNSVGKRNAIAPISKRKMVLSSMLAGYVVQLIGIALLFVYTIFVLKVDYGSKLLLIIVLACIGTFAGLSIGIATGTLVKTGIAGKIGILISITMVGCFLSGMMGITMKYIIDTNVPILNIINPANMITDGLYSLYYYDTLNRYTFNLISLVIFSAIMIVISYRALRRQKYDSI